MRSATLASGLCRRKAVSPACGLLRHGCNSARQIQDLRPALTEPRTLAGVTDQLRLVRARIDLSGNQIPGIVAEELRIDPAAGKDSTMFVTALDLAVVRAGTVEGNARANDDNPVPTAATT